MSNRIVHGYESELAKAFAELAPCSLLAIGPHAMDAFTGYQTTNPKCHLSHIATGDWLAQVDACGQFDLVFLSGVLEHLSKPQASMLLARLRDMHTKRLYALVPLGKAWIHHASHWEQNDLIAYGMELVNIYAEHGRPMGLFKFDLYTYKATPEWLNSKYWAHPEMWDKR